MSEVQPLISGEGENYVESGWDAEIEPGRQEQSTTPIANDCTVDEMFEQHPHDTIRFLQTRGVEKLAEFDAEVRSAALPIYNGPLSRAVHRPRAGLRGTDNCQRLASVGAHCLAAAGRHRVPGLWR